MIISLVSWFLNHVQHTSNQIQKKIKIKMKKWKWLNNTREKKIIIIAEAEKCGIENLLTGVHTEARRNGKRIETLILIKVVL